MLTVFQDLTKFDVMVASKLSKTTAITFPLRSSQQSGASIMFGRSGYYLQVVRKSVASQFVANMSRSTRSKVMYEDPSVSTPDPVLRAE
jgi:hypothetical protein